MVSTASSLGQELSTVSHRNIHPGCLETFANACVSTKQLWLEKTRVMGISGLLPTLKEITHPVCNLALLL